MLNWKSHHTGEDAYLLKPSDLLSSARLKVNFFAHTNLKVWKHKDIKQGQHTLYFVLSGDGQLKHNGVTHDLMPRNAYLIPKHIEMDCKTSAGLAMYWTQFSLDLNMGYDLLSSLNTIIHLGEFKFSSKPTLMKEKITGGFSGLFHVQSLILSQLSQCPPFWEESLQRYQKPIKKHLPLIEYIHSHLSAKLRLNDLAEICHLSPPSLSRSFKRDMGVSLKKYLQNQLNEQACVMLAHSQVLIKDIAHQLGYDDEHHFTRNFTKSFGKSPTKYRQFIQDMELTSS
jgi:AraC-like DNA-binding protein